MQYQVTITETLKRNILIDAISLKEAEIIAWDRYHSCDIVLDWSDFTDVDLVVSNNHEGIKIPQQHFKPLVPYFKSTDRAFTLLHGDCFKLLREFDFKFSCIFADPPYDRAALKHLDEDAMKDALDSMLIDFQLLVEDHDYDWCDAWEQVSDDYVAQMTDAVNQGIL